MTRPTPSPLEKFSAHLKDLLIDDYQRPFVCQGSPLDCPVFVVGVNAATDSIPFWDHWITEQGFHYDAWLAQYQAGRLATPSAKGRRKSRVSPTRRNLTLIRERLAAQGIAVLETNLYSQPTARAAELHASKRSTQVFEFLLSQIQPRLLLVHGREAVKGLQDHLGQSIQKPEQEVTIQGRATQVLTIQHLSYQFSANKAVAVADQIHQRLASKS